MYLAATDGIFWIYQMTKKTCQFALALVVAQVLSAKCAGQEQVELKRRFLTEAPAAWAEFFAFSRTLQGKATYTEKQVVAGKENALAGGWEEFKQAVDGVVRVQISPNAKGDGKVIGANPHYTFRLKRESSQTGWVIADLQMADRSKRATTLQKEVQAEVEQYTGATCLRLWNLWLPTLIQDRDFKIQSIRSLPAEGGELIRIDFEYPKKKKNYPSSGGWQIAGGWMVLDPAHDWVLREFDVYYFHPSVHPDKSWVSRKIDVKKGTGGHPILTRTTLKIRVPKENYESVSETEWSIWEDANLPIEQCSLSAFGLPEPDGVPYRSSSRWYLWIIGIAAVSLIIGVYLLRRAGRASAANPV